MRPWTITDSHTTDLEGFDLEWLPPQAYQYVTPRRYSGDPGKRIALEAGPYIGMLPLTNGDVLYIAPRAGQDAVSRMLMVTGRLEQSVRREFEELSRLASGLDSQVSWVFLLSRAFAARLRTIETRSLRFDRQWVTERRWSMKGCVDVPTTLLNVAQQQSVPIQTKYRRKTYNTPEHRILAAASGTLLFQRVVEEEDRHVIARWASRTSDRGTLAIDLRDVVKQLNAGQFSGPRAYYISALVMAQLILLQRGIILNDEHAIESESLLTNVNTLFERYIRVTVRGHLSDSGFLVEKLESGAKTLFVDGTGSLEPDIIVSDRSGIRLLMDAKYKPGMGISAGDHYQMATYLRAYHAEQGIIVRPQGRSEHESIASRRMVEGGTIHELSIALDDWIVAEQQLLQAVNQVLRRTDLR